MARDDQGWAVLSDSISPEWPQAKPRPRGSSSAPEPETRPSRPPDDDVAAAEARRAAPTSRRADQEEFAGPEGLDALPSLARIAASVGWHTGGWALRNSLKASRRLSEVAVDPTRAGDLVRDARGAIARLNPSTPPAPKDEPDAPGENQGTNGSNDTPSAQTLREEGELLLRRSRDVSYQEEAHPAYERIIRELAPDEARILRLLLLDGPQPTVDIRTGGPLGLVHSHLIAPGLSMIGARAGCRYVDRVPSYLNNLFRLGLIWFSRETLRDPLRYQVLEAQPEVLEAIHSVRQAKVVRRSVHLTPFGDDFCRVSLTAEGDEFDDLPIHSAPSENSRGPQPPEETDDD